MERTSSEPFGDYRLVRLLGEGGFAEVYEAEHVHLPGVKAAIKLLKGSFTSQQIEELRREALIVSKLDHPHIVQLRTFSIDHGRPYLVMAYAQGGALNRQYPRGTRLALPEILAYVRQIAEALQYAHEQKIVHRDLKPANLLLTQDGRVQVADFGIAVVTHTSHSKTIQEIAGTWVYMAPEQFRGQAEPASDQYALAIIVYQWLSGTVPFDGRGNMYLIPQQQKEEAPPSLRAKLPDLFPGIEAVVMKALAKDPSKRFASIQEFAEALEEASRPPFVPILGQRLGDYRLVRKLGEGGFAEVYEAEHLHLGTKAAIKLLKGTFTSAQVEELRQEARAVIQLDHQHIIRAYGFSIECKTPYLIMAYAPGGSLATRHEVGKPLPLSTICEYVRQIAAALQYAHDQKITHCDIKPENILLAQDERLQVADFGIAIMAQETQVVQGEIVGSWTYMAPEQFTRQAEPASDQYALGIMVYEWLCGEPPFTSNGSIYALPSQHMSEAPPSLRERIPSLSSRVEQVVMRTLAKQPGERFASISAFAQALEEACTKLPIGMTLLTYEHLGGSVECVAWSPDGTLAASGGKDATVRIWDTATGQTLLTLRGHSNEVSEVVWSPNGQMLASASKDKTVLVWEAASGKQLLRYTGHTSEVRAVAWSPDGQKLASASGPIATTSEDNAVLVWEAASGKLLLRYTGHSASMNAVAWSPDGQKLASASGDNTVQIWEAASGRLLLRYTDHAKMVNAVAWSPDGQKLASASEDNTVQVWEVRTGKLGRRYTGHTNGVSAVAWSPDGQKLASASGGFFFSEDLNANDTSIQVWEVRTGKLLLRYARHTNGVSAVAWSPDGYLLASASIDSTVQVWEARTGKLRRWYAGHALNVRAVAWSPDGCLLASGSNNTMRSRGHTVQVRETKTGKLLQQYAGHVDSLSAVAWSPDGQKLASASVVWRAGDPSVHVWEARTGKLLLRYTGHTDWMRIVAWSPDGRLLVSTSDDQTMQVWEVSTGKVLRQYEGHADMVRAVTWSSDGQKLAAVSRDNTVQVWEVSTGKVLRQYEGRADTVRAVAWSPDGQKLAAVSEDNAVQVWEVSTGQVLLTYREHFASVFDVVWSPDGERIASAGSEVRVWVAP